MGLFSVKLFISLNVHNRSFQRNSGQACGRIHSLTQNQLLPLFCTEPLLLKLLLSRFGGFQPHGLSQNQSVSPLVKEKMVGNDFLPSGLLPVFRNIPQGTFTKEASHHILCKMCHL